MPNPTTVPTSPLWGLATLSESLTAAVAEIDRLRIVINAAFDEIDDSPDEARMILKHSGVINDA